MLHVGLYYLLALWAIIYVAHRLFRQAGYALPLHAPRSSLFNVVLKPFHLIIDTTIFNQPHDTFAAYLYKQPLFQNVLRKFYSTGNLFGVLGMFGGITVLTWTTVKLLYITLYGPNSPLNTFTKRAAVPEPADLPFQLIVRLCYVQKSFSSSNIQIPGITAPIGHLPILLLALFVGQTIHELGHAISASL